MLENRGYDPTQEFHKPDQEEEKDEITPYQAHRIFENAVINNVNEELEAEGKPMILSDVEVSLKWFVDEETPEGYFSLVQHKTEKTPGAENKIREYIMEKDEKTGETYQVEKISEAYLPQEDTAIFYDLDINKVREIFNKLDPKVKKSFIDGWKESLKENINQVAKLKDKLKVEKRNQDKENMEQEIIEYESAQEKIKKELQVLA